MDDSSTTDSWSAYEQNREQQTLSQKQASERYETQQTEFYPGRRALHKFFIFYSFLTLVTAMLMGVSQCLGMTFKLVADVDYLTRYVISLYLIILSFLAVLTELEWTSLVTSSKLLTFWVTRGLLYIFMGVLSLEQVELSQSKNGWEKRFLIVVSWMMVGFGAGYFIMGLLCLQYVLNRFRFDYKARRHVGNDTRKKAQRSGTIIPPPTDLEMS